MAFELVQIVSSGLQREGCTTRREERNFVRNSRARLSAQCILKSIFEMAIRKEKNRSITLCHSLDSSLKHSRSANIHF